MAGNLQPLVNNQKIVKPDGTPTDYFIRWAQQKQIDISGGITAEQVQELIDEWSATRKIIAGVGLSGGGDLSADRTIDLEDTAVTPGTYGDATHVGQFTVDQQGRLTGAANVPISGGGGGGNYTKIARQVLATNAANILFSTISQSYEDLIISVTGRGSVGASNAQILMQLNIDAGLHYDTTDMHWFGSSFVAAQSAGVGSIFCGYIPASTAPADYAGEVQITIPGYSRAIFMKQAHSTFGATLGTSASTIGGGQGGGLWRNIAAITDVNLFLSGGSFLAGSVATIYGRG